MSDQFEVDTDELVEQLRERGRLALGWQSARVEGAQDRAAVTIGEGIMPYAD